MSDVDIRFMGMALSLGRRGLGRTWPNPSVGCVIVRDGRVVGRGVTGPGGRPHGEPQALAQAGEAAKGATVYVGLEPCSHHGETPPCSAALIAAKVGRVVAPLTDSDPRVSGRGFEMLRDAGIEVVTGVLADQALRDHAGFFMKTEQGRPMVTLKLATSFDGRIATASGESRWITGAGARRMVHALRASHDAVMVGGGTARADDPMLMVRDMGVDRQPVRIVASRRLDLPLMSALARSAKDIPLWLVHGPDADAALCEAWRGVGARLIEAGVNGGMLDMGSTLRALGDQGLTRVFCEGGGALAASLLASDLVDELIGFTAGLGLGAEGLPAIGAMGIGKLSEAQRFKLAEARPVGGDVMHRWERA